MGTKSGRLNWVCVYKTSCEADAESKHQLLTEFGIEAFIEDWGNTADLPFGASTIARAYRINVDSGDLESVKKLFRKKKIVGHGIEDLQNGRWLRTAIFFTIALVIVGLVAILPGIGKWLFFMSIPFIVLYLLKYLIDKDHQALKK